MTAHHLFDFTFTQSDAVQISTLKKSWLYRTTLLKKKSSIKSEVTSSRTTVLTTLIKHSGIIMKERARTFAKRLNPVNKQLLSSTRNLDISLFSFTNRWIHKAWQTFHWRLFLFACMQGGQPASPVGWCSFCCNAAPVHLWWACGAVLSPFLQEAAHRAQTTLSQNNLSLSRSSCEKPSSSSLKLVLQRNYYPRC